MQSEALFLSIRPIFLERLMKGSKTIELRRVRPNVSPGQRVLLYASSPTRALVGSAVVDSIATAAPTRMWTAAGKKAAVSRDEFFTYFEGAEIAVAIGLREVLPLAAPIPLTEMRLRWPWLRPPQSFRFVMVSENGKGGISMSPLQLRGTT